MREERGFTLTEVLVTMTIMVVVLFALYNIFDMSVRIFSLGNGKAEATENARLGMEKMEREIRQAYAVDRANGNTLRFQIWEPHRIRFGNDLDGSTKIECPNSNGNCELITYQVFQSDGSTTYALGRANSADGTLVPAVDYVDYVSPTNTGLNFEYLKANGDPAGAEGDVERVRITLRVRVPNAAPQDATQTLVTDVALRNPGA